MARDNTQLVMAPESLQFMRSHPPPSPSPSNQRVPCLINMKALRPPSTPINNKWVPPHWLVPPGPRDRFGRCGRPTRPLMEQHPVPRLPRFVGRGRDNFFPKRNNQRFQNPRCKIDANPSGMGCPADVSKVGNGPSDCRNKPGTVAVKVEASSTGIENSIRSGVKKRKPKSRSFPGKPWNREDAEKALKVEMEADRKQSKTLIVKFPDPDLSSDMIKTYHNAIEKVYFLAPSGPRYCFLQLTEDSDIDQVISDLNEMDFYNLGKLKAERKCEKPEPDFNPECIDPYTLYVGNLPITVNPTVIKEMFPTSLRIDVGFAQRLKNTRYAFIRYQTVEESIEAFKSCCNVTLDTRNLIIRFRRQKKKRGSLVGDLETKLSRKERQMIIKRKRDMEDLKKLMEKKIKKEKVDGMDENDGPTLSDLIGNDETVEDEQESEEEKEVDDEDEDDDDEECHETAFEYAFNWKKENGIAEDDEEDDEEEEEEEEEDDDEEDNDDE